MPPMVPPADTSDLDQKMADKGTASFILKPAAPPRKPAAKPVGSDKPAIQDTIVAANPPASTPVSKASTKTTVTGVKKTTTTTTAATTPSTKNNAATATPKPAAAAAAAAVGSKPGTSTGRPVGRPPKSAAQKAASTSTPKTAPASPTTPIPAPTSGPAAGGAAPVAKRRRPAAVSVMLDSKPDAPPRKKSAGTQPSKSVSVGPEASKKGAGAHTGWSAVSVEVARRFTSDDLSLIESGLFADATVVCLKREWKVHKTILCTRNKWFEKAFTKDFEEGKTGIVNLHDHPEDDVDTLLRFIYSGSLDMTKFNLKSGSFVVYSNLYNLGEQFQVEALCDDALTLLGQYADQKLEEICSYDRATSGRHGVENNTVDLSYVEEDLFRAIWAAYGSVQHSTRLQSLLASFVWAGRDRLLRPSGATLLSTEGAAGSGAKTGVGSRTRAGGGGGSARRGSDAEGETAEGKKGAGFAEGFMNLADRVPQFGTDIFKLMLGNNTSQWIPSAEAVRDACTGFDHTRKTQHPDRCEWCDEVFDEVKNKKAMYNPFKAVTRPVAWCEPCVDAKKSVLWRVEGEDVEEEKSP